MSNTEKSYRCICISIYTSDLEQLDAKVEELKRRGWSKATRSHLIRLALTTVDIDAIERALAAVGMIRRRPKPAASSPAAAPEVEAQ
jgi:hypothetical protein